MGDVVELKRKVSVQIARFGHTFKIEYQAGLTPELSDPAAALYLDGTLLVWLTVGFAANSWEALNLDLDDEHHLIDPPMVGMSPTTEATPDLKFLLEAEEYVLSLLSLALGRELARLSEPLGGAQSETTAMDPRHIHPRERGRRAAATWHDHGSIDETLPDIIAVEVYDALESMGISLADALEEDGRPSVGQFVRDVVDGAIQQWKEGE